jgi:hypothetical protein
MNLKKLYFGSFLMELHIFRKKASREKLLKGRHKNSLKIKIVVVVHCFSLSAMQKNIWLTITKVFVVNYDTFLVVPSV